MTTSMSISLVMKQKFYNLEVYYDCVSFSLPSHSECCSCICVICRVLFRLLWRHQRKKRTFLFFLISSSPSASFRLSFVGFSTLKRYLQAPEFCHPFLFLAKLPKNAIAESVCLFAISLFFSHFQKTSWIFSKNRKYKCINDQNNENVLLATCI